MKRRTPYSLVCVNRVSLESIISVRAGQKCIVGVDVAKKELVACLYWPDRTFERPWKIESPGQIGLFVEMLKRLSSHCPLVVAMESSGTYGDALRQALHDQGLEVRRVSGKAVKDHAETFDGVPSQHDGKDAAVIAELCWMGKSAAWAWEARGETDQAMRYWIRKLDTAQRLKQVYCGKLESMLARHWPELGGLLNQSGPTATRAIARWGSPGELAKDPEAAKVLRRFGGAKLKDAKIERVIASARTTAGVRMTPWEAREIKEIAEAITRQRKEVAQCKLELRELSKENQTIKAQEPALGLVTACVLWMCLGDAKNYGSAAAYRKAMGLNLKERSSGQHKGKPGLSKRGQRLTRKWLYFSALRWMKAPSVRRWTEAKKQRDGGRGGKAVTAVMRRLALAAYHVGKDQVAFDAARLFPGTQRPGRAQHRGIATKRAGDAAACVYRIGSHRQGSADAIPAGDCQSDNRVRYD